MLHPVSIEEREAWFGAHEAANRQVYALRELCEGNLTNKGGEADCGRKFDSDGKNFGAQNIDAANQKGEILAWGNLSDYHPREGYRITAEITVYAAPEARGKGLGGRLVNFMLERAPEFGIKNAVALIFRATPQA